MTNSNPTATTSVEYVLLWVIDPRGDKLLKELEAQNRNLPTEDYDVSGLWEKNYAEVMKAVILS